MPRTDVTRAAAIDGRSRDLLSLILADPERVHVLEMVRDLQLPNCWVGAGFVRNAVWDHLHGRSPSLPDGDVDVVWFDPVRATPDDDRRIEERLTATAPTVEWSIKNQARMHARNGDAPYTSTVDALRHWTETATAVAVRLAGHDLDDVRGLDILAPFGLDDLFALIVRPPPAATASKRAAFEQRLREKRWLERWPRLRVAAASYDPSTSPID